MILEDLVLLKLILLKISKNVHLQILGPEPLSNSFNFKYFKNYLKVKIET